MIPQSARSVQYAPFSAAIGKFPLQCGGGVVKWGHPKKEAFFMSVTNHPFGVTGDGQAVTAWTLTNAAGASLTVLDYGVTLQALRMPNAAGGFTDVLLGYDTLAEYETQSGYFGATIGRVGNRIGGGVFSLDGVQYQLACNNGPNHLHGGVKGFSKYVWDLRSQTEDTLVFSRLSPDGEEGYPGNLQVQVSLTLTADNAVRLHYEADTDRDTIVSLTNHSYFNLAGHGSVLDHTLQVNACRMAENDETSLPTGRLLPVAGTAFDFRAPKPIGRDIAQDHPQLVIGKGYDHNFVLSDTVAAVLRCPESGIVMTVETDLPGMQVYTANHVTQRAGKGGTVIQARDAVCLETQLFPNAMARYGFPSPVLHAGEHLSTVTAFRFSVL